MPGTSVLFYRIFNYAAKSKISLRVCDCREKVPLRRSKISARVECKIFIKKLHKVYFKRINFFVFILESPTLSL